MQIAPLKYPHKIPDILFYNKTSGQYNLFNMLSLKLNKKVGFMVLQKANTFVENYYQGKCLFLNFISSFPKEQGFGQIMLDFAKNIAKQDECNGHIILKADSSLSPNKIPHLFYRKNDFTTLDSKIDKKMDKFIKQGKIATHKDFPSTIMYYPAPEKYSRNRSSKLTFVQKIQKIFQNIFQQKIS